MKHFDLFSGYGGFSIASERLGFETIGFSEIDKYASAVLKHHWPKVKNYGDITKINWSEVPDFDLLTGGSPCQDLSIAGKRAGLEGKRSGLFFEYMRAVREKKPKYFIWENVKGALSSNGGWDFSSVLNEMAEAGYSLWWQVLNAKDFGVPQNRERIFVVGFRDECPREIFFERSDGQVHNGEESSQSSNLKSPLRSQGDRAMIEITKDVSDAQRIYNPDGIGKSLKALGGGQGAKTGLYAIRQRGRGKNKGGDHEISPTLSSHSFEHNNHLVLDSKIRRLTPIECERLMGLPDDWTKNGIFEEYKMKNPKGFSTWTDFAREEWLALPAGEQEISDTQRYKLCGNGVVVNVVEFIIKSLIL